MTEFIYLIEKGWIDPSENHDSYGYKPWSYTDNEQEAIDFCTSQGCWTGKDCYSLFMPMEKYRYIKINVLSACIKK